MKMLYVLLLVAASQAAFLSKEKESEPKGLPAPNLKRVTAIDPLGFDLEWVPVETDVPITGYKVKIWEQPKHKVFKYEIVDGKKVLVEEFVPVKFPLSTAVPDFDPKDVITTKPDQLRVNSTNVEAGLIYEFRVQAFTEKEEGPLSTPMRLQYVNPTKDLYIVE